MLFSGLTAFPLTPLDEERIDEPAFAALIARLRAAGVDALGVLGSTGSFAYLHRAERRAVASLAVDGAAGIPVIVGIGALRTRDVLTYAEDAQSVGAAALLLAPVPYHPLSDDEVFGLFRDVASTASVPIVVYDNPDTTHFTFSAQLHARIAELEQVRAVKIPPVPLALEVAQQHVNDLKDVLPADHSVGISGDESAAVGLSAGCDGWYSMIAGVLPEPALRITRAAQAGDARAAQAASSQLEPL